MASGDAKVWVWDEEEGRYVSREGLALIYDEERKVWVTVNEWVESREEEDPDVPEGFENRPGPAVSR